MFEKMAKSFKEQFTNWLIGIVAFGGSLWVKTVIENQSKILEKLDTLSVMMATANSERGTIKEQIIELKKADELHNDRLNKIQGVSKTDKLFKHEDYITLN